MKSAGKILKYLINYRSANIDDIIINVGITKKALESYLSDQRTPRDEIKIKIANYFKVPISYIFR